MARTQKKALILDTSAFIVGFDPHSIQEEQFTVPMVREELISSSMAALRLRSAVESGKLKIRTPSEKFVQHVKETSKNLGDTRFLSEVDTHILALAFELKASGYLPVLVSDDYSIQNVASRLGIQFTPLITFGIKLQLQWILYCPACHRKYASDYPYETCRICGTRLKRKPSSRKLVEKE